MAERERNDYLIKVPVQEIHNWYFRVWAANEREAIEKFKNGFNKTFLFDDRIRCQNAGEPVIIDKEKIF